mgnify:CR=1 FL=1
MNNFNLKRFDLRAAIIFIAAHFLSAFIYNLFVFNGTMYDGLSGFSMHLLQASIYLIISLVSMKKELRIASLAITSAYVLIAANWFLLERGIELDIQSYFYAHFSIYLLGRDSAIRVFNNVFARSRLHNKFRLFHRSINHNSVCNIDLPVCTPHIKNKGRGK